MKTMTCKGIASMLLAAAVSLSSVSTATAIDATAKCLAGRAKAKGKYEACVNNWIAACYGKDNCDVVKLSKCSAKLRAAWDKLVQIDEAICAGSRWVDNGDGTLTDQLTDLVWELKTDDGSVHDQDNTYSWSTGSPYLGNGTAFTDLLQSLNSSAYAGANDWRMPTLAELMTILNQPYPCASSPCVDSAFGAYGASALHWSATTHPFATHDAWSINFADGEAVRSQKATDARALRAVRGGS